MNKVFVLIFCVFLVFGCSKNRFKNSSMINGFTFGLFGYDDIECRKKYDSTWMKSYSNGKYPSKICTRYKYYTCHINNYCNNDKDCEEEAALFWTPNWQNANGNLEKRVQITQKVCDIERNKNSGY